MKALVHGLLLLSSLALAQENSANISAAGRGRILENIETINQNIRDTQANLASTQKNQLTLETEFKDVQNLESDHLDLRKKYQLYIATATKELEKNDLATVELQKWEKEAKSAPKEKMAYVRSKLEAANQEREDRTRWKADAKDKLAHVNDLLKTLNRNLSDLQSRKGPLRDQINSWSNRGKNYEKLLAELGSKRTELEKLARK